MSDSANSNQSGNGGASSWMQLALSITQFSQAQNMPPREGPRLEKIQLLSAGEGDVIPRLFGRMRLGGKLIWTGALEEHVYDSGGSKGTSTATQRDYSYTMHLAIGLCEGPISHIGRVWADGILLDTADYIMRLNTGADDQLPDPLIETIEGVDAAPAYRGLAYVVFQDFNLTAFGNRVPQLSFEVFYNSPLSSDFVRAVNIIPGATEFGYHPSPHGELIGMRLEMISENLNASPSLSDWRLSLDALQDGYPNCKETALVVTWYGTDLRVGDCKVEPRVMRHDKVTIPTSWTVAGKSRSDVNLVSTVDGRPAYGGTPSDDSVVKAIEDLHARGLNVVFYPFLMMDIPAGNNLPNPYGGTGQPVYPWRGRITCDPAPSAADTVNGTQTAYEQVKNFIYGSDGKSGLYAMMEHYATLCAQAGGVEAFLIGSEFEALSPVSKGRGEYILAGFLREIAARVREILPDTKISYAANWGEYGSFVEPNGDVFFPLDEYWSSDLCDFIAIDAYFPLSDWRDGDVHLDALAGARSATDMDYLQSQVEGGEYYDWYYASQEDRDAQIRSPITDGAGQAWVYRAKDIRNWWQNAHQTRLNWVLDAYTAWQPQSKPIWFTEIGCPAVDKGSNEPNRFPDQNASDAGLPHYSNGQRDDLIQRQYLRALRDYYLDEAHNPVSDIYGAPMLDCDRLFIWAWDARPFPAFPYNTDLWADSVNWHTGHWLNGRLSTMAVNEIWEEIVDDDIVFVSDNVDVTIDGYVVDRQMPRRNILEPLLYALGLDMVQSNGQLKIAARHNAFIHNISQADLLDAPVRVSKKRNDMQRLPNILQLHYIRDDGAYELASVTARKNGDSLPIETIQLPLVMPRGQASDLATRLLYELHNEAETIKLSLPPAFLTIEPGDVITYDDKYWRVTAMLYQGGVDIEAVRHIPAFYDTQASIIFDTQIDIP